MIRKLKHVIKDIQGKEYIYIYKKQIYLYAHS